MHCFVVCSKPCTSNTHGLLSRAKVARTPVDYCGSDMSNISCVPEIISKMLVSCAALIPCVLYSTHAKDWHIWTQWVDKFNFFSWAREVEHPLFSVSEAVCHFTTWGANRTQTDRIVDLVCSCHSTDISVHVWYSKHVSWALCMCKCCNLPEICLWVG